MAGQGGAPGRYDPGEVVRTSGFLIADAFVSALFALLSEVLAEAAGAAEQVPAPCQT